MNRELVKRLREDCLLELGGVAEKHGLKVEFQRASFTEYEAGLSFRFTLTGELGEENERMAFALRAALVGLDRNAFGKQFASGGKLFTIERINTRSRTAPVICRRSDGKLFKFPVAVVASRHLKS